MLTGHLGSVYIEGLIVVALLRANESTCLPTRYLSPSSSCFIGPNINLGCWTVISFIFKENNISIMGTVSVSWISGSFVLISVAAMDPRFFTCPSHHFDGMGCCCFTIWLKKSGVQKLGKWGFFSYCYRILYFSSCIGWSENFRKRLMLKKHTVYPLHFEIIFAYRYLLDRWHLGHLTWIPKEMVWNRWFNTFNGVWYLYSISWVQFHNMESWIFNLQMIVLTKPTNEPYQHID